MESKRFHGRGHSPGAEDIVTHRFPLERAADAYKLFNEKKDGVVKIVLKP